MAVKIYMASEGQRTVADADGARLEGPFFVVTRSYGHIPLPHTVLTLPAEAVRGAEVETNGVVIEYVMGGAKRPEQ